MCPACFAIAGLAGAVLRPWLLRRRARERGTGAGAWRAAE